MNVIIEQQNVFGLSSDYSFIDFIDNEKFKTI